LSYKIVKYYEILFKLLLKNNKNKFKIKIIIKNITAYKA